MSENLDHSNLKQVLRDFPKQFAAGLQLAENVKLAGCEEVLVLGMGGSALPADLLNLYLAPELEIEVNRDYELHAPVDSKTLVLACSYSGNTEETLTALEMCLQKKAQVVILAAGGKLLEIADKQKLAKVVLPSGLQPRCATGYFFAAILQVLENSGLVSGKIAALKTLEQNLQKLKFEEQAQGLAEQIKGKVPVVYAADKYWAVARNLKIKFNEHAKTQSFWNVFPELNHNEMVGFTELIMPACFLVLRASTDHPRIQKRMQIFSDLMKDKGIQVVTIDMQGADLLTKIFSTVLLGDWTAYYLALAYGIDPTPVAMVEDFKQMME